MIMTDSGYFKKLNLIQIIGFFVFFGIVFIRAPLLDESSIFVRLSGKVSFFPSLFST